MLCALAKEKAIRRHVGLIDNAFEENPETSCLGVGEISEAC